METLQNPPKIPQRGRSRGFLRGRLATLWPTEVFISTFTVRGWPLGSAFFILKRAPGRGGLETIFLAMSSNRVGILRCRRTARQMTAFRFVRLKAGWVKCIKVTQFLCGVHHTRIDVENQSSIEEKVLLHKKTPQPAAFSFYERHEPA